MFVQCGELVMWPRGHSSEKLKLKISNVSMIRNFMLMVEKFAFKPLRSRNVSNFQHFKICKMGLLFNKFLIVTCFTVLYVFDLLQPRDVYFSVCRHPPFSIQNSGFQTINFHLIGLVGMILSQRWFLDGFSSSVVVVALAYGGYK
jgi:hypothetical protein